MKKMIVIWLALAAALVLSACAVPMEPVPAAQETPMTLVTLSPEDREAEAPRIPENNIKPPLATLTVGGRTQEAGLGTYCWTDASEGVGICLDAIGIATAQQPLMARSPFTAQFSIPVEQAPRDVRLSIREAAPELEMNEEAQGLRWWAYGEGGEVHRLELEREPSVELSLEPGLYVLDLFVSWEALGDASYGFLVEVE